jgi:SWI/SNF-related matrix-associated actin-dependent regulator of chromatin subfamily A3
MPRSHNLKRSRFVIDLTGDDDEEPQTKVARIPERGNQRRPADRDSRTSAQDDEDGANDIIDLTGDVDEHGNAFSLVGRMQEKVVGLRYYDGFATKGEAVTIVREPSNPYDSNAMRVNNVQGTQIGHLPRAIVAKLAPYMDSRSLLVEGVLVGEKGFYDCPISLTLWATSEPVARAALEAKMKADRLPVIKQSQASIPKKGAKRADQHPGRYPTGFTNTLPSSGVGLQQLVTPEQAGPSLEDLVETSQRFRPREIEELVEQWGTPEDKLANMPMAEQPAAIRATLLPYQLQVSTSWEIYRNNN